MGIEKLAREPKDRSSTILVVDDEILVRIAITEFLRDCGYSVIEAANAAQAIKVLSSDVQVDILLTDVEMPGEMNGFGLARWTREHRPAIHILLTSGNPAKALEARDLCLEEHFVGKPAPLDYLRHRIARVLTGRPGE